MSAALFLTTDEFMEILLAEMPVGVFADDYANDSDPAKRSVSSSELRAACQFFAEASANLELINDDKFLSTVTTDGLLAWEADYFTTPQDSTQTLEYRRQNLVAKIRSTGGISLPAIKSVVAGILGSIPFDLLPYSGQAGIGAWVLGASQLGYGTWLAELDPIRGARTEGGLTPLDCGLDYAAEGLTSDQLLEIQRTAYMYEVRIYGNADDKTIALLNQRLTELEPARSTHIIRNNQTYGPVDPSTYLTTYPEYTRLHL